MVAVDAPDVDDIPVTTPVNEPTVAMAVVLLLHTPLPVSDNAVVWPTHTTGVPIMAIGAVFTVIVLLTEQSVVALVYVIVAVPEARPVTSPDIEPTLAVIPKLN